MLRLIDIITTKGLIPNLRARDRDEAIYEMLEHLVDTERLAEDKARELLVELLKRETLGSTGIGHGVAIPHIKTDQVKDFVGVLARSRRGIDFSSIDAEPVNVIILFLSPLRAVSGHLQMLSHVGGLLRHHGFLELLRDAVTEEALRELVEDAERMIFGIGPGGDESDPEGPDVVRA